MKRLIKFIYIVISVYCIVQASYRFLFNWDMFHSFRDVNVFILCLMDETTAYSSQYSEDVFMNIKIGISKSDVKKLLGEPLLKLPLNKNNSEIWKYTYTYVPDGFYWVRWIEFNDKGVVVSKVHEYTDA